MGEVKNQSKTPAEIGRIMGEAMGAALLTTNPFGAAAAKIARGAARLSNYGVNEKTAWQGFIGGAAWGLKNHPLVIRFNAIKASNVEFYRMLKNGEIGARDLIGFGLSLMNPLALGPISMTFLNSQKCHDWNPFLLGPLMAFPNKGCDSKLGDVLLGSSISALAFGMGSAAARAVVSRGVGRLRRRTITIKKLPVNMLGKGYVWGAKQAIKKTFKAGEWFFKK